MLAVAKLIIPASLSGPEKSSCRLALLRSSGDNDPPARGQEGRYPAQHGKKRGRQWRG